MSDDSVTTVAGHVHISQQLLDRATVFGDVNGLLSMLLRGEKLPEDPRGPLHGPPVPKMTVANLITQLAKLPQDAIVLTGGGYDYDAEARDFNEELEVFDGQVWL